MLQSPGMVTTERTERWVRVSTESRSKNSHRAQELWESRGGRPGLPSLIHLRFLWTMVSMDVRQHWNNEDAIVQELCESRGGRPGLSVLTSLMVSMDVEQYWTILTHWSLLVPNTDVNRHPTPEEEGRCREAIFGVWDVPAHDWRG